MIRGYQCPALTAAFLYEKVTPILMCKGPDDSILVLDGEAGSVELLQYFQGTLNHKHSCSFKSLVDQMFITRICFSNNCGYVIMHHEIVRYPEVVRSTIAGLRLSTAELAWEHDIPVNVSTLRNGERKTFPYAPFIGPILPDGRICSLLDNELFILDPQDEQVSLCSLMSLLSWPIDICCKDYQLAFLEINQHGTRIVCYELHLPPSEESPYVALQDIVVDESEEKMEIAI